MLRARSPGPKEFVMGWFILLVALVTVWAVGRVIYRRRNVTDEYRALKPFNPSHVRGHVEGQDMLGPSFRSGIRKDPGAPPKL